MAVADDSFAILEDALIAADVGVTTAADIVREAQTLTGGSPRDCLAAVLERRLLVLSASLNTVGFSPFVIVVMGTNGGGKTTTIAKLCRYFARQEKVFCWPPAILFAPPPVSNCANGRLNWAALKWWIFRGAGRRCLRCRCRRC